jgi:manganese transport protein
MVASVSTAMAEILGSAIALNMLFKIPLRLGAALTVCLSLWLLLSNSYRKIEKIIIGFVSVIGLSFVIEVSVAHIHWGEAAAGWLTPSFPPGSMPIIMSVLGAVVMPHNLFLHSEVIQSRQWNLQDEQVIHRQLKYEFGDTLFSMIIGWAINSAMILMAASAFYHNQIHVTELGQAKAVLEPLLGGTAALIFSIALLFSGLSSSITAGMAGGSIFAGIFAEPYDIADSHTKTGVLITLISAAAVIFFVTNPLKGLLYSQMLLSVQLPVTIFTQIYLTSSKRVMGKYANSRLDKAALWVIAVIVVVLNAALLFSYLLS